MRSKAEAQHWIWVRGCVPSQKSENTGHSPVSIECGPILVFFRVISGKETRVLYSHSSPSCFSAWDEGAVPQGAVLFCLCRMIFCFEGRDQLRRIPSSTSMTSGGWKRHSQLTDQKAPQRHKAWSLFLHWALVYFFFLSCSFFLISIPRVDILTCWRLGGERRGPLSLAESTPKIVNISFCCFADPVVSLGALFRRLTASGRSFISSNFFHCPHRDVGTFVLTPETFANA